MRALVSMALHAVLASASLRPQTRLEVQRRLEHQASQASAPAARSMSPGDWLQLSAADQKRARKADRRRTIGH